MYKNLAKTEVVQRTFYSSGEKESEQAYLIDNTSGFEIWKFVGSSKSWYKNGQLKREQNYIAGKLNGKNTQWHEDGKIYYTSQFINGQPEAEAITYYPDGKLKRKEVFSNGLLKDGKCFTKAGNDTVYFPIEEIPVYPGGEVAIAKYIKKNLKYPRQDGTKGLVVVQFVVDKSGSLTDLEVVKNLSPELDAESLRLIRLMPGNWKPARKEGKPISFRFTLPLRYAF